AAVVATRGASPSPGYPAGIDPCLLGNWRVTTYRNYGLIGGDKVQYTGGAGQTITYNLDFTTVGDYSHAQPMVADYQGAHWEDTFRGTVRSRYHTSGGLLDETIISSNVTSTLTRDGRYNNGGSAGFYLEPSQYSCQGDTLVWNSTQGNDSGEAVRVR
ncbi:MAG TPA: hypothetical protein VJT31_25760, partial [Rugosimonospora sp.]|nr:hypothetical protein [Rugosimonospora sp.]